MEEYQKRVVKEKEELDIKTSKLRPFLETNVFQALPKDEQERLDSQLDIMDSYSAILNSRIIAFGK